MALILHAQEGDENALKTLIAAEYCGVQVEVKNFVMGVSNKTPEFLQMNPLGKVPVLETPGGAVFESTAMARYASKVKADRAIFGSSSESIPILDTNGQVLNGIARHVAELKAGNTLYGSSAIEKAHVEQWIDFSTTEIDYSLRYWLRPRLGFGVYLPHAEKAAVTSLKKALGALNTHLASNTYLVGHSVTLADIILTCNLFIGFKSIMTKSFTSDFPHVERYFWTLVHKPKFHKVLGDFKQADCVPPLVACKKNEIDSDLPSEEGLHLTSNTAIIGLKIKKHLFLGSESRVSTTFNNVVVQQTAANKTTYIHPTVVVGASGISVFANLFSLGVFEYFSLNMASINKMEDIACHVACMMRGLLNWTLFPVDRFPISLTIVGRYANDPEIYKVERVGNDFTFQCEGDIAVNGCAGGTMLFFQKHIEQLSPSVAYGDIVDYGMGYCFRNIVHSTNAFPDFCGDTIRLVCIPPVGVPITESVDPDLDGNYVRNAA